MRYIIFYLFIFFFIGCEQQETTTVTAQPEPSSQDKHSQIKSIESELSLISSVAYQENYIIQIINHGSPGILGYKAGAMEGGYAHESDAHNIARYVLTLSGQKSSDDIQAKKSEIFYTSNCGGCHGHEGKGLNGAFPNLTIKPLLGISMKKKSLELKLQSLKNSL